MDAKENRASGTRFVLDSNIALGLAWLALGGIVTLILLPKVPEVVGITIAWMILLSLLAGVILGGVTLFMILCSRSWKAEGIAVARSLLALGITVPILAVGIGLPFVSRAPMAAKSIQNSNNVKQLAMAMLRYAEAHQGQLPPHRTTPYTNAEGKTVYPHSWRVYVLPYLENHEQKLFDQIRLDEPWDSEWNRQYHNKMPAFFASPFAPSAKKAGVTTYCVPTGEGAAFPTDGDGPRLSELPAPAAETLLLLEAEPRCWMDPTHDLSLSEALAGKALYQAKMQTTTVAFFDASVFRVPRKVPFGEWLKDRPE